MSERDIADVLNYYGETNEFGLEDNPTRKHMRNGAAEIIKLRAENASLKEVISLSEDSRLMDEYIKLERANARQAERIAELEAQLVIEKGQLDLRDEENRILFSKTEDQSAALAMAKTALENELRPCGCLNGCEFCGGKVSLESALAAINALPEVAEKKASE